MNKIVIQLFDNVIIFSDFIISFSFLRKLKLQQPQIKT